MEIKNGGISILGRHTLVDTAQNMLEKKWEALIKYGVYDSLSASNLAFCHTVLKTGSEVHSSMLDFVPLYKKIEELQKLIDNRTLIKIKTSEKYIVEPMDASLPALLPKGFKFINRLAQDYRALCDQKNIEYIPFRITSATRTIKSVKELRQNNGNAIENSAHLKGKTIDISYLFNNKHVKQKDLFIKALSKLKDEGLCYVKFEVHMKCLHITCR
jgi:hypothetical protein